MVDPRESEQILGTGLVEAGVVDTLLGDVVISKKILRTRKIMVMHSNERGECVHVPS